LPPDSPPFTFPTVVILHLFASSRVMVGVSEWTTEEVCEWLRGLDLGHHVGSFREQAITGETLCELTADELKEELGVSKLGERKKLLLRLEGLRQGAVDGPGGCESASATQLSGAACMPQALQRRQLAQQSDVVPEQQQGPIGPKRSGQKLYLLDGRNIACSGNGFSNPDPGQLRLAQEWFEQHRPDWSVKIFLYQGLADQWKQEKGDLDSLLGVLEGFERILTPSRKDVDKFIIRSAVDAKKQGLSVRIVSNDAFDNYVGGVDDAPFFDRAWVKEHVVKFAFDAGGAFVPSEGIRGGRGVDPRNGERQTPGLEQEQEKNGEQAEDKSALPQPRVAKVLLTSKGRTSQEEVQLVDKQTTPSGASPRTEAMADLQAMAYLQSELGLDAATATLMYRAEQLQENGQLQEALGYFEEVLGAKPDCTEAAVNARMLKTQLSEASGSQPMPEDNGIGLVSKSFSCVMEIFWGWTQDSSTDQKDIVMNKAKKILRDFGLPVPVVAFLKNEELVRKNAELARNFHATISRGRGSVQISGIGEITKYAMEVPWVWPLVSPMLAKAATGDDKPEPDETALLTAGALLQSKDMGTPFLSLAANKVLEQELDNHNKICMMRGHARVWVCHPPGPTQDKIVAGSRSVCPEAARSMFLDSD